MTRPHKHPLHSAVHAIAAPVEEPRLSLIERLRLRWHAVRAHRRRNARLYRHGGLALVVVIGVVVAAQIGLIVAGRLDVLRLSGTAAVQIVSTSLTGGSSFDQSPAGTYLHYTYQVDGATYTGTDFRRWFNIAAHEPKVCYEPGNPGNHLLVEGRFQCGSG